MIDRTGLQRAIAAHQAAEMMAGKVRRRAPWLIGGASVLSFALGLALGLRIGGVI